MGATAELHWHRHVQQRAASRDARQHRRAMASYFTLPKYLLSAENCERIWQQRNRISPASPHEYSVSSAMLSEVALVNDTLPVSERKALLDMAAWDLEKTLEISYDRHNTADNVYRQKFLLPPNILRLETRQAALGLFDAMIDGDVTREVRHKYAENILTLSAQASEGFDYFQHEESRQMRSRATEYIGLAHELNAIYSIARKHTPTLVAFTTFPRGDSGEYLPRQTHDIHIVGLQWGAIEHAITAEVKTRPKPEHYDRYEAVLIGGTVHLHPDDSPDPSYLTERFVKEYSGIASQAELDEIESVSETVMHSVRHGFTGTTQCRDPRACTLIA